MHIVFSPSLELWLSGALSAPLIVSHCVSELDLTDSIIHRNFEFMTLKYEKKEMPLTRLAKSVGLQDRWSMIVKESQR